MFKLNDIVLVKSKNVIGTIVDIRKTDNGNEYTVENNAPGKRSDGYGGLWALFDCAEDEIVFAENENSDMFSDKKAEKRAV